ncbi:MAG: dockerin type I repeat-containing protein [Oscillospiraceae bacterium]|nr:dockerin type I repeat-containing protein [Oscillospiraceae bacterium]
MKKALSMALVLVMALAMFTGLGITAAAADEVYLKITISEVVKTGDKTYEIYTTYENPEGYHFIQSMIEIYFNPAQIKFTRYAPTYMFFDAEGISPHYGDVVKDEFIVMNNIRDDYMKCAVVNDIGLTKASGNFLCFGVELLEDDLTAIDFELVLYDAALEFGVGPDVVMVPDENVTIVNNDGGEVILPLHSHTFGEWEITKEATCTQPGEKTRACTSCDETETEAIEPLGHDWGEWIPDGAGESRECDRCGEVETRSVGGNFLLGHVSGGATLSVTDARMVLQHLVGKSLLTPEQQDIADVDGDGDVTITDARLILQMLVEKISNFPREANTTSN